MRSLWLGLLLLSCVDFDALLKGRCDDGGVTLCPGASPDASTTGTGGGGGGTTSTGGGTTSTGGGAPTGSTTFCNDGWCWENPLPFGSDVYTLWGTGDDDIWAAGGGRLFAHWNGSGWTDESMKLPLWAPQYQLDPSPYFSQSASLDSGVALLDSEGTLFRWSGGPVEATGQTQVSAIWPRGNSLFMVRDNSVLSLFEGHLSDAGTIPIGWRATNLRAEDGVCLAAVREGSTGENAIADCRGTGSVFRVTEGYATGFFRLRDGGLASGSSGDGAKLYVTDGGAWWPIESGAGVALMGVVETPRGAIAVGSQATFYNLDDRTLISSDSNGSKLLTAWYSPLSHKVFAGGQDGEFRTEDAGLRPANRGLVTALFASDAVQLATSNTRGLLIRDAQGRWSTLTDSPGACAVAAVGDTAWVLANTGMLLKMSLSSRKLLGEVDAGLAMPPATYGSKCGAMALGDGGVYVGSGNTVAFVPFDGGSAEPPSALAADEIVGLALIGQTLWASANTINDAGTLYSSAGGPWKPIWRKPSGTVAGVAAGSGGVWVTGTDSFVALVSSAGAVSDQYPANTSSSLPNAVDVLVRPDGTVWVLFDSGALLQHPSSGGWQRSSPPWSSDVSDTSLLPTSLSANSTRLFITGSRNAILSKPLP